MEKSGFVFRVSVVFLFCVAGVVGLWWGLAETRIASIPSPVNWLFEPRYQYKKCETCLKVDPKTGRCFECGHFAK